MPTSPPEKRKPGRPAGTTGIKHAATLLKDQARTAAVEVLKSHLNDVLHALVTKAKGVPYLVTRDTASGEWTPVTQAMLRRAKAKGERLDAIEVWERQPDTQAIREFLDRLLDRPQEPPQAIEHDGEIVLRWQGDESGAD